MNHSTKSLSFRKSWSRGNPVALTGSWFSAVMIVLLHLPTWAVAQETESNEQSALVDGLLDLINEPAPTKSDESPASATHPRAKIANEGGVEKPETNGRSLGLSRMDHPLAVVQNNMRMAASQLSKGVVGVETQQLQSDIVRRLDVLIEELQRHDSSESSQPQPPQPPTQSSTSQSSATSESSDTPPSQSTSGNNDQPDNSGERQPSGSDVSQDGSSQSGRASGVTIDLADPLQLQQDVWGQLPDQVRKQMQSKMVERFLPSHRTQIEAYFRALLQNEAR